MIVVMREVSGSVSIFAFDLVSRYWVEPSSFNAIGG